MMEKTQLELAVEPQQLISKDETSRISFIGSKGTFKKIKLIAILEGDSIKNIMNSAMDAEIKKYERPNGEIIIPESKKK